MVKEPDEGPDEMLLDLLPYEYAQAIGYVVAAWAKVEHDIDEMIWSSAGIEDHDIGACLTSQYSSVHARINALLALARLKGEPEAEITKLHKFSKRIADLSERRNRLVHDSWKTTWKLRGVQSRATYRLQRTARAKLDHDYKPVSLDELAALKKEIEEAFSIFNDSKQDEIPF